MSKIFTANEICCLALGAIGAFPPSETAPAPEHLRRAMEWLDLLLAETVGTQIVFSRVPDTISFTITNGTQGYNLYTALGSQLPDDRIMIVKQAWLEDDLGDRHSLEIVTREKFEDVPKIAETGRPCRIYIDRAALPVEPRASIFPTPATTDPRTYTVKLVVQRGAPNLSPGGVNGSKPFRTALHDLAEAWQRWLVLQLAHDLGSGPVWKIPPDSLDNIAGKASIAKAKLDAFENREHETTPPICESWGLAP